MSPNTLSRESGTEDRIRLLEAAADPVRLSIVFLLGGSGPMNVGDIAARFSRISRPAISHHLRVLRESGVVASERHGQEIHYSLDRDRVVRELRELADAIEACCPPTAKP